MSFIDELYASLSGRKKRIILPESEDERVLQAVEKLSREKAVEVLLLGEPEKVHRAAGECGAEVGSVRVVDHLNHPRREEFAERLHQLRKHKGVTQEDARRMLEDPIVFAVMMVKMDEVDGIQVLDHVMAECPRTRVVLITGYATVEVAREALVKGAFDFIAKPFKPKDLRAVLNKAALSLGHQGTV